jgi:hypothetical protein
VGSLNKAPQVKHLGGVFENMSQTQAKREMLKMGLSAKEREKFIKNNDELSRVFGVKKDGTKPMSRKEARGLLKKAEMHKKFNIKRGRDIANDIKNKHDNPLDNVYGDEKPENEGSSIGAKLHSDVGDHGVAALGGAKGSASITKSGPRSVVGGGNVISLNGGVSKKAA